MRNHKLTPEEKRIEQGLLDGKYIPVSEEEYTRISAMVARRKKDAVLNIRINSNDIDGLKQKAKRLGIKYQTFISEILHKVAL